MTCYCTSQWWTQGIHWTTIKVDKCQGWHKVQCPVNKKQPAVTACHNITPRSCPDQTFPRHSHLAWPTCIGTVSLTQPASGCCRGCPVPFKKLTNSLVLCGAAFIQFSLSMTSFSLLGYLLWVKFKTFLMWVKKVNVLQPSSTYWYFSD